MKSLKIGLSCNITITISFNNSFRSTVLFQYKEFKDFKDTFSKLINVSILVLYINMRFLHHHDITIV